MPDASSAPDAPYGASGGPGTGAFAAHSPFPDPKVAARAVLSQLRQELGFGAWAVTRVTGGTYVVLATGGDGFPAAPGEQFPWSETLCHAVLQEQAPRIAPDIRAVAALQGADVADRWRVGAYVSTPLTVDGTSLFGTLCAVDREPQPEAIRAQLPLVDLQARLLSTLLAVDVQVDRMTRRAERAETEALVDPLTGLVNRRGWQLLVDREEQRCRRYGAVASVLAVDLDGLKAVNDRNGHAAGDAMLQRAAEVLRGAFRSVDAVARLGGDEFGVLAVETDAAAVAHERDRLQSLFRDAGVAASIGIASREAAGGLAEAWSRADRDMYAARNARLQQPPA